MHNDQPTNDNKLEANNQEQPRTKGEVRIRSNICLKQSDWFLVPGDVMMLYGLQHMVVQGSRQHEEMMYYEPCSICRRTIFEINKNGCERRGCIK